MTALLLILLALPGPQEGEIAQNVSFDLERHYRAGFWTFVRISLENRSTRSMEIEAVVDARSGDQRFETRSLFSMGPGSKKTRFVYYRPDSGVTRTGVRSGRTISAGELGVARSSICHDASPCRTST